MAMVLIIAVFCLVNIKNSETGKKGLITEGTSEETMKLGEDLYSAESIPVFPTAKIGENGVIIPDIEFISQANYSSGCESISTVMALNYAGIEISVDDFIDYYLPWTDFIYENGKTYGYHPDNYFMGNPYTSSGYGCYAPCIEKAIVNLLPDGFVLTNTTGKSISYLCDTYINKGIPVIFWATEFMTGTSEGPSWTLIENNQTYTWTNNEHCLVLTGYDEEEYFFNDPMSGKVSYDKETVEKRYAELGLQSLVVYSVNPEKNTTLEIDTEEIVTPDESEYYDENPVEDESEIITETTEESEDN